VRPAQVPGLRRLLTRRGAVDESVVLFDSWSGRYSDNPRAISEALHRRGLPLRQVWVLEPGRQGPEWASAVEPGSREHLRCLGRAGHIVANNTLPGYFRKRPGATFVQTWHGTPLKRIAFDMPPDGTRHTRRYLDHLAREVSQWDVLLSPNRFSSEVLRRAFRYEGPVLETGYPRNDVLVGAEADAGRKRMRRQLELPPEAFVVLYTPTFRRLGDFQLELDVRALAEELGPDAYVLVRGHHLVAREVGGLRHPRVLDVTAQPEDVRDLYLAADALVTDYSSAMFDFAVTGKPMVFFTYDLEHYRDELRGFCFDFEGEAPGPLVRTSAAVAARLADPAALELEFAGAYEAFRSRFCHLDDGRASDRVVDALFDDEGQPRTASGGGRFASQPKSSPSSSYSSALSRAKRSLN
jgi:CDP-glycerol glycerophosphotransferase